MTITDALNDPNRLFVACSNALFTGSDVITRIEEKYNTITNLKKKYPNYTEDFNNNLKLADFAVDNNVGLLILSEDNSNITYTHFVVALEALRSYCEANDIHGITISLEGIRLYDRIIKYPMLIEDEFKRLAIKTLEIDSKLIYAVENVFYATSINVVICT